jgi:hypothetical protein
MAEKTAKQNLFASAKKVETSKESKSKMPSLPVTPEIEAHLKNYKEAKAQYNNWEGKKAMEEGIIKEYAVEQYLTEYKKHGRNIGSFKLGEVTVSVQDRYSKMSDDVAAIVTANFPDVIETTTEYQFDQKILDKYIDQISEALQNAEGIPEEDLQSLILVKEVTTVKKGTIDTLASYGDRMKDLFQAIAPVISLR